MSIDPFNFQTAFSHFAVSLLEDLLVDLAGSGGAAAAAAGGGEGQLFVGLSKPGNDEKSIEHLQHERYLEAYSKYTK